jgi:formylglycine-generating enzyme required for sulfatase activity
MTLFIAIALLLPQDPDVTLKGSLVCDGACVADPKTADHGLVLFVAEGPVAERLVKEGFPEQGLDADAAVKLMDEFSRRLKVRLDPDSPALKDSKNAGKNHYCMPAAASAVSGSVREKDGVQWIRAAKIEPARLTYPARLLTPDKPFARSDRPPVTLKVTDSLTLTCVPIPPGKYLMGTPVYMWPYYVEEYPHVVTLTKPFHLAEIPVTQEMYEALMGDNPSPVKDPQLPVGNPRFAEIERFCKLLSEKNGKKVRLPTDAEWEYAARVGTSNPGFESKYKDQNSTGTSGFKSPLKVKSKQPNPWRLYDMASCWWEITADKGMYNVRHAETDPRYPPPNLDPKTQRSGRGILKLEWSMGTHEFITEKADYAGQKFRVLVEE